MEEDVVRFVLFPCVGAGAAQVRTTRLEHSLRVQRIRPQNQRQTDAGHLSVYLFVHYMVYARDMLSYLL